MSMEWRSISWLAGYEVSERGGVRRTVPMGRHYRAGASLKGTLNKKGYRAYQLRVDGRIKNTTAHQLVCEAWHGPCPPDKDQVAHFDGDKLNNHYSNLRWANRADNAADSVRLGTMRGERRNVTKLTQQQVDEIRRLRAETDLTLKQIGERFGVTRATVHDIITGRTWF